MKIKLSDLTIDILYTLLFAFAFADMRYQLIYTKGWDDICDGIVILILLICFFYFFLLRCLFRMNKWIVLLFIMIVYEWLVTLSCRGVSHGFENIRDILIWPLVSIVFYDYFSKNSVPKSFSFITIIGMSILYVFSVPNLLIHLNGEGRHGGVIGPIYYLFSFFPVVYLSCKKKITTLFLIMSFVFILLSTKRVGFLIVVSGAILIFMVEGYVQDDLKNKINKNMRRWLFFLLLLAVGYALIQRFGSSVIRRFYNLENDEGSGRLKIWKVVWLHFNKSTFFQKLYGHGCHAVKYDIRILRDGHVYAHNSYLETLYDYGYIGLGLIILLVIFIFSQGINLLKNRSLKAPAMFYTFPIIVLLGLFGYFFEEARIIVPISAAWGICMAQDENKKARSKKKY